MAAWTGKMKNWSDRADWSEVSYCDGRSDADVICAHDIGDGVGLSRLEPTRAFATYLPAGETQMPRRLIYTLLLFVGTVILATGLMSNSAQAAGRGQPTDWNRFYYYPYVYYPQSFERPQGSYNNLYYRYPPSRRIPVYNKSWYNYYPTERPYHRGHHFYLDVF